MEDSEILNLAKTVIQQESAAVATLVEQLDAKLVIAARWMMECQGHVLVSGAGTSHAVAMRFAHLLSCCGTPSLFIDAGDSQHGLSGAVTERDILVVISKGGTTVEINNLVRIANKRKARVIAITEKPESILGQISDLVLHVVAPEGADLHGMIATGSSLVNSAYCDALCIVMATLRNYSLEAFGLTHPGGAVGMKLQNGKIR